MSEVREEEALVEIEVYDLVIIGKTTDTDELSISVEDEIDKEEAIELLYQAIDVLEEILQEERQEQ